VVARRVSFDSAVTTGRGDDGTTGLLYGGDRIAKDDPRTEAYGAVDEAVAALGLARAVLIEWVDAGPIPPGLADFPGMIVRLQRELFVVGAELATNPAARDRAEDGRTRVSTAMVEGLDGLLIATEAAIEMPREFVVPGDPVLIAWIQDRRGSLGAIVSHSTVAIQAQAWYLFRYRSQSGWLSPKGVDEYVEGMPRQLGLVDEVFRVTEAGQILREVLGDDQDAHSTLASLRSLSTRALTSATFMPALRLEGSTTFSVLRRGATSTPSASGFRFSRVFFLAFMMFGRVT